jgi:7-carboxy-7-deazaguanine synthase
MLPLPVYKGSLMNKQAKEPLIHAGDGTLDVAGTFLTIQGEGPFSGHRAFFIRLAGCNLQCPLCDTDYTSTRKRISVSSLALAAAEHSLVVITGGEPFRQPIGWLLRHLAERTVVQVETNGVIPLPEEVPDAVHIVVSPKVEKVHSSYSKRGKNTYFKYVVNDGAQHPDTGLPLKVLGFDREVYQPSNIPPEHIYLQPLDEKDASLNAKNREAVFTACLEHGYTAGVQLHKLLGAE